MKAYEFTLDITGYGDTPEAAWEDAVDTMLEDLNAFCDTEALPPWRETPELDLEDDEHAEAPCDAAH